MRKHQVYVAAACLAVTLSCAAEAPSAPGWPSGLPVYDHIVIVVEENKDYEEVIDNPKYAATYINEVLKREGANFIQAFGEEHFSQGNYYWLFSGDNQGVGFVDQVPTEQNNPDYPFTAPNLGSQLIAAGLSFKGYAESLPEIGATDECTVSSNGGKERVGSHEECTRRGDKTLTRIYARKHVPWISFANVPNGTTMESSSNLRFEDFPKTDAGFRKLPTVSFVIPNLENDMHNGPMQTSIPKGDQWLRDNLDDYYQWAKRNNSLLILTFDENDDTRGYRGLTNPLVDPVDSTQVYLDREYAEDMQNRVVTIFAGAHIKPGNYVEGNGITHVNILRTIEAMYGLPKAGRQQHNATGAGISDDYIITDVFEQVR